MALSVEDRIEVLERIGLVPDWAKPLPRVTVVRTLAFLAVFWAQCRYSRKSMGVFASAEWGFRWARVLCFG